MKSNARYQFQWQFWPSAVTTVLFIILVLLGIWQIKRYHAKQLLMKEYQQALQQKPLNFTVLPAQVADFQPVRVTGTYLNERTLLLQHRFYQHHLGVAVLTPLRILNSPLVLLVDRGWLPLGNHQSVPTPPPIVGRQTVQGFLQKTRVGFMLGKNILAPNHWPLLLQQIDLPALQRLTHLHFYPAILSLHPALPVNGLPQRHLGYAIQWFALALALVIAFIFYSRKRGQP